MAKVTPIKKETVINFNNLNNYQELGFNIAYYRKKQKGVTQQKLADMVGITRQHMAGIEAPGMCRPPSLEVVFNIANVLKVPVYKLFIFRE